MTAHILLIHGVGPFDKYRTEENLKALLLDADPETRVSFANISSFDWSAVAGSPIQRMPSIAKAFLELPYAESEEKSAAPDANLMNSADGLLLSAQVISLLLLPALLPALFASLETWSITPMFLYGCATLGLFLLPCGAECFSEGPIQMCRIFRRSVFIWVWPLLYAVVTPMYVGELFWSAFENIFWILFLVIPPVAALVGAMMGFNPTLMFTAWAIYPAMAVILAAGGFIYFLVRSVAYPPLKVICDVVVWIHNPEYRTMLRSALGAIIADRRLAKDDVLIIAAHSLGSMIALDYMLSPECLSRNYVLITMGCPLRTLFCKFFPKLFSSPAVICEVLADRNPRFEWINVFRPCDWIGRQLGVESACNGSEQSTGQHFKFHTNYWGDRRVFDGIETCIRELRRRESIRSANPAGQQLLWPPEREPIRFGPGSRLWRRLWASSSKLVGTSVAIVAILGFSAAGLIAALKLSDNPLAVIACAAFAGIVSIRVWRRVVFPWISSFLGIETVS